MYVLVYHRIREPVAFWRIRERPDLRRPVHLRLVHALPSRDHKVLCCLWESDSLETVRSYADGTYGSLCQSEYHEIDEDETLGCWSLLCSLGWSFRRAPGFLAVEPAPSGAPLVSHASPKEHSMSSEQNKQIVRQAYQVVTEGLRSRELDRLDEFVARDVEDHNPDPGQEQGLEGLKRWFLQIGDAFPDLRVDVQDLLAEGEKVAARVIFRGTHSGDFQGMPATGKQIDLEVIEILRIENGKIRERWGQSDKLGMMQQLGAIPA